jgi:hypothetical protein
MDILEFIAVIENHKSIIESSYLPDVETGQYLNYEIIDDDVLNIDWGWTSYEECDNNTAVVTFGDKINVQQSNSGNSCFGGNYDNTYEDTFDDLTNLIKWFESELN